MAVTPLYGLLHLVELASEPASNQELSV